MNKSNVSKAVALALGTASLSAQADLTSTLSVLEFDAGVGVCSVGGTYPDNCDYGATDVTAGSFFSMDSDGNGSVAGTEKVPIVMLNGVQMLVTQPASGSHTGAPDGSESPDIDNPWSFFGNTGMHQTTSAVSVVTDNGTTKTLDFSGWSVTWNGIADIPMGGDPANFATDTGLATITCSVASCSDSSTYTLDYAAHVPLGDASNFGGVAYALRMEGHAAVVPVPAAAYLFGSGLLGLVGVARRRARRRS